MKNLGKWTFFSNREVLQNQRFSFGRKQSVRRNQSFFTSLLGCRKRIIEQQLSPLFSFAPPSAVDKTGSQVQSLCCNVSFIDSKHNFVDIGKMGVDEGWQQSERLLGEPFPLFSIIDGKRPKQHSPRIVGKRSDLFAGVENKKPTGRS
ncbi:hypothetical protein LR69_03651 [Geobacillus sp. BCO2]|nr:hypothetical protein LR69_03651 [Geobacillus sp. BCO2]